MNLFSIVKGVIMKKYVKYIVGGLGFFLTMILLDYVLKSDIDLKVSIGATIIYLILNILCDFIFQKKDKK